MKKQVFILATIISLFIACSDDADSGDTGGGNNSDGFERSEMLVNWADNIIVPSYTSFEIDLQRLGIVSDEFAKNPNEILLNNLREAWLEAYKSWQHVEMFNIGKAEEIGYSFFMNVYPTNVNDIEENIASAEAYDLDHVNNQDAQGFPALDYLLYGVGEDDSEILAKYTTDDNADAYVKYVKDVVDQMVSKTALVIADWNGAYRDEFVGSLANTSTSSVNKLTNDYVFYYEKLFRAGKIGIPAGVFSGTALPGNVEAFYKKDISKELTLEALNAVVDFFNGKHYSSSQRGESFKTYLEYLSNDELNTIINNQFDVVEASINGLENDYTIQITTDNTKMTKTYDEIQKNVVKLKVDMLQAFNISVDYVDADGD